MQLRTLFSRMSTICSVFDYIWRVWSIEKRYWLQEKWVEWMPIKALSQNETDGDRLQEGEGEFSHERVDKSRQTTSLLNARTNGTVLMLNECIWRMSEQTSLTVNETYMVSSKFEIWLVNGLRNGRFCVTPGISESLLCSAWMWWVTDPRTMEWICASLNGSEMIDGLHS